MDRQVVIRKLLLYTETTVENNICLLEEIIDYVCTGWPNKHGNSVTNSMSFFIKISIVIPYVKTYYNFVCYRVYFTFKYKAVLLFCVSTRKLWTTLKSILVRLKCLWKLIVLHVFSYPLTGQYRCIYGPNSWTRTI